MRRLNVLIVDDDEVIRELFMRLLGATQHVVYTTPSGEQAIELAKQVPFDVAFIDIRMPRVGGLETFRELKRLFPGLTAVMITGFADQDKIDAAIQEGALTCLRKPFEIADIQTIVANQAS
jgi:two-component system response regulator (stage 0 sporulation protein F)